MKTPNVIGQRLKTIRERGDGTTAAQLRNLRASTAALIGHVHHRARFDALAEILSIAQRLEVLRDLIK
jgi:hypothetical protein